MAREVDISYSESTAQVVIPSEWVRSAIGLELGSIGVKRLGLDVADGGRDSNCLCWIDGVVVDRIEEFRSISTIETARRAYREGISYGASYINYDNIGVGSGVKAGFREILSSGSSGIEFRGVNVGKGVSKGKYSDGRKKSELFVVLKDELWWDMRRRFEKTWEYVNNIKDYEVDELISIPNDGELINELSRVTYSITDGGRIKVTPKSKMRGMSPNRADALILGFYNPYRNVRMAIL